MNKYLGNEMINKKVRTIGELVDYVTKITYNKNNTLYFRGENKDFDAGAFQPSVYRNDFIRNEEVFYREMQRFNDQEFITDRTAIDKLTRMQHYEAPTRLIDLSEDVLNATYFALENKKSDDNGVVYIVEIDSIKINYYDSDAVSVVANLAKLPLDNRTNKKSKREVIFSANKFLNNIEKFNKEESIKFLLHEIKEEKPYFEPIINPQHIFSILGVKPKYNNQRIHAQKGAFLLFGLNKYDESKHLNLITKSNNKLFIDNSYNHPIVNIHKVILDNKIKLSDVEKLGITLPYIYPEIDRVSKYLKNKS